MRKGGTFYICDCCGFRTRIKHGLGKFLRRQRAAHERGIAAANA
jgi:hypothetical protein